MKKQCMYNTISNNTATKNTQGGIVLRCMASNYNAIEGNNVSESGSGINIGGRNNTIRHNTVLNNLYYGIKMGRSDGSYNNTLYENTVCENGVADIKTCGPECYGNHGCNNTCNTTLDYDDCDTTGCTFDCSQKQGACVTDDGTAFFCGDTVTESCILNGNMTCPNGSAGLIIGADNIVIDGNGYRITGNMTNANCMWCTEAKPCTISGIYNEGYDNVVVKNLEIEGFCTGIGLKGTGQNKVLNNTIDTCKIHDNGFNTISGGSDMVTHGVHACFVKRLEITESDIYNNEGTGGACGDGGNGIFIYAGIPENYCDIKNNKLHNNAKAGFWTKMRLSKSNITHNEIWGNGNGTGISDDVRGGVVLRCRMSNENLIAYNDVHDHASEGYGYGIYVGGSNNTIKRNTVNGSTMHGISMARSDGSCDNKLYENTVCKNNLYDISTCGLECHGNTGDNNTCNTTSNYDDEGTTGCRYCCGPAPDLTIIEKLEEWVNLTEKTYNITCTIKNTGTTEAGASTTSIEIDGTAVATDPVPQLAAGESHTSTLGPFTISGNSDTIKICADRNNDVLEKGREYNNCLENIFIHPQMPELVITEKSETWVVEGSTYSITYTIKKHRHN
ncbi:MAG: hypothetical protein EMLJLAPB_00887 [Candidatus Argoarchaeum ethanivorans]|uniref:Right handed beta helix domain-containing protein n=1 Tax=Candidatus Argoarchaeum ethanivorans TaxID=2608793 RepID=A0A811TG27_9EURY|nr:MAG: hypothetical protein EMLJLAPB_00887 [Candidatus Argoarchaeum ethanivorans]